MTPNDGTLVIEDARILFRNFKGEEGQFNAPGDRNFCLLLEPELAEEMAADGWNIKMLKPREEGDPPLPYIQVSVKYVGRGGKRLRPPKMVLISSRGRTELDEDLVEMLDYADIKTVDLIIRPHRWDVNGKSGIKAYVKSLFATINEDELELKYADIQDVRFDD